MLIVFIVFTPLNFTLFQCIFNFQIGTNGIISFDQPVYSYISYHFPSNRNDIRNLFIVAPFWDDVDIRRSGNIFYKIFTTLSDDADVMVMVNDYIFQETGEAFYGEWMLVVTWDHVHPWPHGEHSESYYSTSIPDYIKVSKTILRWYRM